LSIDVSQIVGQKANMTFPTDHVIEQQGKELEEFCLVLRIMHTVGFRLLQDNSVLVCTEMVFCADLGNIVEIGIGEFGIEEVEG
jgi:hypothetical protein